MQQRNKLKKKKELEDKIGGNGVCVRERQTERKKEGGKEGTCIFALPFPGGSNRKDSACNAGHPGSIPGLGRSPGEGNGNPLQYSCRGNSMDRGDGWATVHWVAKNRTRLSY